MSFELFNERSASSFQSLLEDLDGGEKYTVDSYLGEGSYGVVWSAINKKTQEKVAIKKFYGDILRNPELVTRVLREIKLLAHFSHPNIISARDLLICETTPTICLVMEVMDMDLSSLLKSKQPLTEQHIQYFTIQILQALDCIHSAGVIHRDLTPSNCLLTLGCELRICDFGLAREENPQMTNYVVTRHYRAPELLMQLPYSSAVDIWACGCIVAEMYNSRKPLFSGDSTLMQLECIMDILGTPSNLDLKQMGALHGAAGSYISSLPCYQGIPLDTYLRTPDHQLLSNNAVDFLRSLLMFNPHKRPSASKAIEHAYLADYCPEVSVSIPKAFTAFKANTYTLAETISLLKDLQHQKSWGDPGDISSAFSSSFSMTRSASISAPPCLKRVETPVENNNMSSGEFGDMIFVNEMIYNSSPI